MNLCVVGAGYVGLVTATCLARMGHVVRILEIDPVRVRLLEQGLVPFFEPGLETLVRKGVDSGHLIPTLDANAALGDSSMVMIAVGTPLGDDGQADLSQVQAACDVAADAKEGALIVVRSTLPLGSTPMVAAWLRRHDSDMIITNPEFLRQGTAVADFLAPSRIVKATIGGWS